LTTSVDEETTLGIVKSKLGFVMVRVGKRENGKKRNLFEKRSEERERKVSVEKARCLSRVSKSFKAFYSCASQKHIYQHLIIYVKSEEKTYFLRFKMSVVLVNCTRIKE